MPQTKTKESSMKEGAFKKVSPERKVFASFAQW